jgi:hypothetical protein
MVRIDGSLARHLDDGDIAITFRFARPPKAELRLAEPAAEPRGRDKYAVLAHRRRRAQIAARRILDLC